MTRLLAVLLDASDVFLMTFMILQDSYMEPTRVGSDTPIPGRFIGIKGGGTGSTPGTVTTVS